MVRILTNKENKIIKKRLSNRKLSQLERNRLSRSIRPKLREISLIDSKSILEKIDYNPKIISIENKIIKIIKNNIQQVDSIILYGSAIQNNYHEYNDIDIIIVTKSKIYKTEMEKWNKIKELNDVLKVNSITSDIEIISKENLIKSYKNSPTLVYQLKDHKIIYGKIKIPKDIEIYKIDLIMKLDWSYVDDKKNGEEIYSALRNTILVRLLLNGVIDNTKLKESLYDELGKNLIERLKNNKASRDEKRYTLNYLNKLLKRTEKELSGETWEKIQLLNP